MLGTLRALLWILGVSAVLIASSVVFLGPGMTAMFTERTYDSLTGWRGPMSPAWPPTMDSELRFYAPFWGVYGFILVVVARDLAQLGCWVPWLAVLFFAGGLGRAISWIAAGPPHPVFVLLMITELVLPPILIALWRFGKPAP